ncbi:MAG: type II toxin-antitoxin system RelE/ParE family toxin [Xanthomonadales bacterium]|nr:type II toxin-antitoxin system RelE/ParE family toxin [Xanthomonadales bacterium]
MNWTLQAQRRLQKLHKYIAKDQPLNADHFIDRLTRYAATLGDNPQAWPRVPKYMREDLRYASFGEYRIIFLILLDRIDILAVRHTARLMPTRLRNL